MGGYMNYEAEKKNTSSFEYIQSIAPEISTFCDPFFRSFGLETFIYGRFFYNGKYIFLTNHIDWVKNWIYNIHTFAGTSLHEFLQNVPLEGEPSYYLWSSAPPQDKIMQEHNRLGLWHGFDIHYRLEDSVEGWSFSTSQDRQQINNFYFSNLKLFHRFCLYIREKAATAFDIKDKEKLATFKENCDFSFQPTIPKTEEINAFLSSLPIEGCSLPAGNGQIKLSKRELDCMFHFSQGKTSKEIGRLLNINPRTVETHFMNIKQKTGYYNKSALADILRDNVLKWM